MRVPLQDSHLEKLRDEETHVSVSLTNGVTLYGLITAFDQFAITVMSNATPQLVYKRVISHIQPASTDARKKTPYVARTAYGDRLPVQEATTSSNPAGKTPVIVRKKQRTVVLPTDRN